MCLSYSRANIVMSYSLFPTPFSVNVCILLYSITWSKSTWHIMCSVLLNFVSAGKKWKVTKRYMQFSSVFSCLKTWVWSWYIKNVLWRAGIIVTTFSKDPDTLFRNHLLTYQLLPRFFTSWKREYVSLLINSETLAAFQAGIPSNWRFKRCRCVRADVSATSDMTNHGWLLQQLRDATGISELTLS